MVLRAPLWSLVVVGYISHIYPVYTPYIFIYVYTGIYAVYTYRVLFIIIDKYRPTFFFFCKFCFTTCTKYDIIAP